MDGSVPVANKSLARLPMRDRALAQQKYASDPKYKKYTQQVDKCLASFDNVHEWADFIAFLKQLLKTFQSYMQFKEIPRKLIVAKRLAQCLNPALPNGVHQRALDVYSHVLAVLGSEGLLRDLPLWSSGLFPFFEYAGTSVKPTLLNIYDTHYLPLQAGLRPIMKSFILALLPGLEEETGEFFDKVLGLLDRLAGAVSQAFFFQTIWLVMLTSPSARGTSLNFLARRLPRFNSDEDIMAVIGRDIGLMIRAFASALEDDNLLVRRGALDLLLQSMKVDSVAVKRAHPTDRLILMRAATSVVLRRDLALNRRLYSWLLGPDEKNEAQVNYLHENVLDLLCTALKDEMVNPSGEYPESRPFKIFVSLLDKWEIGASLTENLIFDAFQAVKTLIERTEDENHDILMTASILYDSVEPNILWQTLLDHIFSEILSSNDSTKSIDLTMFLLKHFTQEDDILALHLPIAFMALVDVVERRIDQDFFAVQASPIISSLSLLAQIARMVPHDALLQWPALDADSGPVGETPYFFACTFFRIECHLTPSERLKGPSPFNMSLESLLRLSMLGARSFQLGRPSAPSIRESYISILELIDGLFSRISSEMLLQWDPTTWLSSILKALDSKDATFSMVDCTVKLAVAMHQIPHIRPSLDISSRPTMVTLVDKLLHYLRPDFSVYHGRITHLIWSLENVSDQPHIESILAQNLTGNDVRRLKHSVEGFGVLWRLTDDNALPGFKLKVPLMIVLDTLKHDNPSLRRVSETWMRCSLKSYLRLLDPILHDLLDPSIRRSQATFTIRGRELQAYQYDRPFDQRFINHLLEILLSVIRFGGQGFAKTARSGHVRRTLHAGLLERLDANGFLDPGTSHMDVLVECLMRFLLSEPKASLVPSMQVANTLIQASATELLQAIVARGEIDVLSVESLEAAVVGKLFFSVHLARLDLQNKLLHLLHSLLSVATLGSEGTQIMPKSMEDPNSSGDVVGQAAPDGTSSYSVNPLLIQTLVDGLATKSNRPLLQHWLDFVLMALPQFQPSLHPVVAPVNDCLCRMLQTALNDTLKSFGQEMHSEAFSWAPTDAEFMMLLNALERIVLLSLAYRSEPSTVEDDVGASANPDSTGILGGVFGVFGSDGALPSSSDDLLTSRSLGYRTLDDGVRVLYAVWARLTWREPEARSSRDESLALVYTRTRNRCRRALEHLFRAQSAEVIESIVECWHVHLSDPSFPEDPAFEITDILVSSAQNAVHMLCEAISCRLTGASERSKRQAINPNLSDSVLFAFLDRYIQRLEAPLALQVWGRFIQMIKDVLGNSKEFKPANFLTLRCLSVLADKVTQTSAMDDKKIRKELQDHYAKLLDSIVAHMGRAYDSGSWIRRNAKEPLSSDRESPSLRPDSRLGDEKTGTLTPVQTAAAAAGPAELYSQMSSFLSETAIPNIRRFLLDSDKILTACTNTVYYIIGPAMKARSGPMDVDASVVAILREITKISTALKAWRTPVVEMLNDNRLFNSPSDTSKVWQPIIKSLFDADKSAFPELLTKVATAPSTTIFSNREYEMLQRSMNLRRMSFVILTGEKNHFLTALPTILEKLVDTLRTVTATNVQSEVFLCIRVLLCRLSPHNLTSFWPVILTEMVRVFENAILSLPADGSDDLQLLLAAAKCLDLLLVLQTEEFQVYQWIFVTDTVDAIYRPDDARPEALLDQLAEVVASLPISQDGGAVVGNGATSPAPNHTSFGQQSTRQPLLRHFRQIDSVRELTPFFSSVSISAYESVYHSGGLVDWRAVEQSLIDDMFDGR